ncbi:MAG: hypothetical protein DDT19_02762 [Syntrophomonadaceae bacterium]|nr:hypothetical protein [Bacillota bacterium]
MMDNAPFGFRPLQSGARIRKYRVPATNLAIHVGDVLRMTPTGEVDLLTAPGDWVSGIAAEFKAASSGGDILVFDNPDEEFVVQSTGTASMLQTHVGNLINPSIAGGNPTTRISRHGVDIATVGTSSALTFIIKALSDDYGNVPGQFARVVVTTNRHLFRQPASGI